MMTTDRQDVCSVVSYMLDNPNEYGIYPTTNAYNELVALIETARAEGAASRDVDVALAYENGYKHGVEDSAKVTWNMPDKPCGYIADAIRQLRVTTSSQVKGDR